MTTGPTIVDRFIELGLDLGQHIDGLVDAYYGPPDRKTRAAARGPVDPGALAAEARALVTALDAGEPPDGRPADAAADDPTRRRWLRAQVLGLLTTADKLAGKPIGYMEEVESCYGVAPRAVPDEELRAAHRQLEAALPGSGPLAERLIAWREAHAIPVDKLLPAISSLAEELREETRRQFGLPDGEHVDFELVTDEPWGGFNWYLGDLRSLVQINTDLPVLSLSLAHLVAHEAFPGHHTEHCHKEVGLARRRGYAEETIFLVGTPQCLLAEGLADLGLQVVFGRRPEARVATHLHPLGIRYDAEVAAQVAEAGETLSAVRGNAAMRLHVDGADPDTVIDEVARWSLLPRARAAKSVEFLMHPTWRAYVTCYVEGMPLCRRFVGGDPTRFGRLLEEQLTPADLLEASPAA